MKKSVFIGVGIVIVLVIGYFAYSSQSYKVGYIPSSLTELRASSTVGVGVVKIFSSALNAQYRSITNTGSAPVCIAKTEASSTFVATTGLCINASSTYEMTEPNGNLWVGEIWALTITGTSTVSTSQL